MLLVFFKKLKIINTYSGQNFFESWGEFPSANFELRFIVAITPFPLFSGQNYGSLGIAHHWDCTHFLKFEVMVAGGGFYSYYIHQGNKSRKENCKKKVKFYSYKKI